MPNPDRPNILGYDLLVYHLDSGSSAWLNGKQIGRLTRVKDRYRIGGPAPEGGQLLPLQDALEVLVRNFVGESSEVERV